jgi:hypothetical protein
MKLSMGSIDSEIHELERRIAEDRDAFQRAVLGCRNSVRAAVSSPKSLFAIAGLGFVVGKVLFRRESRPERRTRKSGWVGLVAGTALSLLQPKFGAGTIARWALQHLFRDRPGGQVRSAAAPRAWAGSQTGGATRQPPVATQYGHNN